MKVYIKLEGAPRIAVFDTGSDLSLVPRGVLSKYVKISPWEEGSGTMQGASARMDVLGTAFLYLEAGPVKE